MVERETPGHCREAVLRDTIGECRVWLSLDFIVQVCGLIGIVDAANQRNKTLNIYIELKRRGRRGARRESVDEVRAVLPRAGNRSNLVWECKSIRLFRGRQRSEVGVL